MSKHNRTKLEKDARNEVYAKLHKKERPKKRKKGDAPFANWCRIQGHPGDCNCVYPSVEEVIALSRKR